MSRRTVSTVLLPATAVLLLVGCGPPWQVMKQSGPPSELKEVGSVGVAFDYSQISLGGKTEEQFLEGKSEEKIANYREVQTNMNEAFMEAFSTHMSGVDVLEATGNEDVTLTVRWSYLVMGKYAVVYAQNTEMHAHLLFSRGDQVVDHIKLQTSVAATKLRPAILQRVRVAADEIAENTHRYVHEARHASK